VTHSFLSAGEAAAQLGVSAKALRLYEERGLLIPGRTAAGWRAYGPADMARGRDIVALRALGLSVAQVGRVLGGDMAALEAALAAHEARLAERLGETSAAIARVRAMRTQVAQDGTIDAADLAALQADDSIATFDLPWPWGGERFDLRGRPALTWIVGPLFSGKTRLAIRIAETIPGAAFVGLERKATFSDAAHEARVEQTLAWLAGDGAAADDALAAVVCMLEAERPTALVFDLIEQNLDEATQMALAAWLRARPDRRPVFAMTRSSAMLDLAAVRGGETIILCPANHSPPIVVAPYPGAVGYEAVTLCLAPPDVRARSEGVVATRPGAA